METHWKIQPGEEAYYGKWEVFLKTRPGPLAPDGWKSYAVVNSLAEAYERIETPRSGEAFVITLYNY